MKLYEDDLGLLDKLATFFFFKNHLPHLAVPKIKIERNENEKS